MDQSACFVLQGGTEGSWGAATSYSMIVKGILNEAKRFDLSTP